MAQENNRLPKAAKAPDALVEATIEKVLKENDRLRLEGARRESARRSLPPRAVRAFIPVAACIAVAVGIGLYAARPLPVRYPVQQIDISKLPPLPVDGRAGAQVPTAEAFGAQLGLNFETLLPGYFLLGAQVERMNILGAPQDSFLSTLSYGKGDARLTLVCANQAPILNSHLKRPCDVPPLHVSGRDLYLAEDQATGIRYGCWDRPDAYFCLSSADLDMKELLAAIEQAWKAGC